MIDTQNAARDVAEAGPFPARLSATRLPTADAHRSQLRVMGYDEVTTRLRLCVNARGEIADVRIDEHSDLAWFDEAVRSDVMSWRYEPFRAPVSVRVCEPVTIRYLP